jgi:hypothetical protein
MWRHTELYFSTPQHTKSCFTVKLYVMKYEKYDGNKEIATEADEVTKRGWTRFNALWTTFAYIETYFNSKCHGIPDKNSALIN